MNIEITEVYARATPGALVDNCLIELVKQAAKYPVGTSISMTHNSTKYTIKSERIL